MLGMCLKCFRVRWLYRVQHYDAAGFPHGICRQCQREAEGA